LKAISEQGVRLNIRKATLRHWRAEFARHLRMLDVEANATERAVRGNDHAPKRDEIYRASLRGDSDYIRAKAEAAALTLLKWSVEPCAANRGLLETRRLVTEGWNSVASKLTHCGENELAEKVREFLQEMKPPRTELEWIAHQVRTVTHRARESMKTDRAPEQSC
jgi:hypothetical protein